MASPNPLTHSSSEEQTGQYPSWRELCSLSDEQLLDVFDACKDEFPHPVLTKYTYVRRIGSDVVMKVGTLTSSGSEAATMDLVRQSTSILVPRVRRYFRYGAARTACVMDYIPGQTLADCWPTLSFWRRICVLWTIRSYIRQLRRVLVPGVPRSLQFPGRIGEEPDLCHGPMFTDGGSGPFASYDELTAWFMHKLEVNQRIRKSPPEGAKFDSSPPLVLTHMDIHPNNVIIDHDGRVWLIDWEFSGFYPQSFEFMVMQEGWAILGKFRRFILGLMAGFYHRQATFIARIGWAIQTGYLL